MCWKQDYLTLKDLEKRGKRVESLEIVGLLRSFFEQEVQPRLENARTALTRAGYQAEIRSSVPLELLGFEDSLLLEVRGDRRSLISASLWFRVLLRPGHNGDAPGIGVLYSQPFGGEREEGFPLGFLAPDRLQDQIDRFLVHQELHGH